MFLLAAVLTSQPAAAAMGWPLPLFEPALTRGGGAAGSGTLGYRVSLDDSTAGRPGPKTPSRRLFVAVEAEWALARRLALEAAIPAMAVRGRTGDATSADFSEVTGFSDVSLLLSLRMDRSAGESEITERLDPPRSCLWAGFQAPTGNTSATDSIGEPVKDPSLLPGAGTFSGLAGMRFVIRDRAQFRMEAAALARVPITATASGERRGAAWQARVAGAWQPAQVFGASVEAIFVGARPDAIGGDPVPGTGRVELRAGPGIRWRPADQFLVIAGVSFSAAAWIEGTQPVSPAAFSAAVWTTL